MYMSCEFFKDGSGCCLPFYQETQIFSFPFPMMTLIFELTSCLSVCCHLHRSVCISVLYRLRFAFAFAFIYDPPASHIKWIFCCFHSLLFLVFILSFSFFFIFLFLIQFFLSLLSCSHYKLQIPYPVLSGHSCKVFSMSVVTFCWCVLKTWRQM